MTEAHFQRKHSLQAEDGPTVEKLWFAKRLHKWRKTSGATIQLRFLDSLIVLHTWNMCNRHFPIACHAIGSRKKGINPN